MRAEALPADPILIGLDGSTGSRRALALAITLAAALGAEVIAVHVAQLHPYPPALYGGEPVSPPPEEWRPQLQATFERDWCEPLLKSGLRYRLVFAEGRPAPTLISTAREHSAGLIVVGSRGVGGFNELRLGSVSQQLVMHAALPVLVVPKADDRPVPSARD